MSTLTRILRLAAATVFVGAAELLVRDRRAAVKANVSPLPGQAEYLDLLRAVFRLAPYDVYSLIQYDSE